MYIYEELIFISTLLNCQKHDNSIKCKLVNIYSLSKLYGTAEKLEQAFILFYSCQEHGKVG